MIDKWKRDDAQLYGQIHNTMKLKVEVGDSLTQRKGVMRLFGEVV